MGEKVQAEGHALLKAVSQGKLRLARLLLEGGAYINEGNERGETALSAACTAHYQDPHVRARMVRYLLEQGADPNMADTGGRTALMHAVHQRAGVHVVSLLLKHGADPSLKDYSGESALGRALVHALDEEDRGQDLISNGHQSQDNTAQSQNNSAQSKDNSDRATLQLLLDACQTRGHQVLILTCCCSDRGHRTVRQYVNTPPERRHLIHTRPDQNHSQNRLNGLPRPEEQNCSAATPQSPERQGPAPSTSGPAPEPLSAASPSDVHVANANGEGVFSFSVAHRPRAPRAHRVLKRLNSEPWGLTAPRSALPQQPPPPQDKEAELAKVPPLVDRPQRRHSIETHDSSLSDQLSDKLMDPLMLTDELPLKLTLTDHLMVTDELTQELTLTVEPLKENSTETAAAEDDSAQTLRRRFNIPSPLPLAMRGSTENLSDSSSPLATRRSRQGAGLLQRRGSGTLLLDNLSQPRPGFLPPLFNPQRPIPDIRAANPAPCAPNPAPCSNPASKRELRKKKLLRRHSMQPEQMKLLSVFQQVLSENEEK